MKRAQARFFIDGVSTKFIPAWHAFSQGKSSEEDFLTAVEHLQGLLPESGFAVGAYSIADVALTPFLGRARVTLKEDLGGYPRGEGPRVLAVLTSGTGRLARFGKYAQDLLARESFQATFDEVRTVLRLISIITYADIVYTLGLHRREVQGALR